MATLPPLRSFACVLAFAGARCLLAQEPGQLMLEGDGQVVSYIERAHSTVPEGSTGVLVGGGARVGLLWRCFGEHNRLLLGALLSYRQAVKHYGYSESFAGPPAATITYNGKVDLRLVYVELPFVLECMRPGGWRWRAGLSADFILGIDRTNEGTVVRRQTDGTSYSEDVHTTTRTSYGLNALEVDALGGVGRDLAGGWGWRAQLVYGLNALEHTSNGQRIPKVTTHPLMLQVGVVLALTKHELATGLSRHGIK